MAGACLPCGSTTALMPCNTVPTSRVSCGRRVHMGVPGPSNRSDCNNNVLERGVRERVVELI